MKLTSKASQRFKDNKPNSPPIFLKKKLKVIHNNIRVLQDSLEKHKYFRKDVRIKRKVLPNQSIN
jgi:hypothetical protein